MCNCEEGVPRWAILNTAPCSIPCNRIYFALMKPADKEILSDLRRIIRSVNLEAKRVEREFGVSIPQYLCLQHLNEQPDFIASMKEIKDALQLNASTATGIVQRL